METQQLTKKMRFPELIECRNTTYEAMLLAQEENHRGIIFQAKCTLEMNRRGLREIKAEMKRWGVKRESSKGRAC